jgi:hypothetical protein
MNRPKKYNKYNATHHKFLAKNNGLSFDDLRVAFNKEFGFSCSLAAIKSLVKKNSLKPRVRVYRKEYSTVEREFIDSKINLSNGDIYRLYVESFGPVRTRAAISSYIRDRRLRCGAPSQRSIEIRGRKIALHHFVWECVNGPLPSEHYLIFIDGDVNNFCIDNLKPIHRTAIHMAAGWLGEKLRNVKEPAFAVCALQHQIQQHG